jgi:hypothetical protein
VSPACYESSTASATPPPRSSPNWAETLRQTPVGIASPRHDRVSSGRPAARDTGGSPTRRHGCCTSQRTTPSSLRMYAAGLRGSSPSAVPGHGRAVGRPPAGAQRGVPQPVEGHEVGNPA